MQTRLVIHVTERTAREFAYIVSTGVAALVGQDRGHFSAETSALLKEIGGLASSPVVTGRQTRAGSDPRRDDEHMTFTRKQAADRLGISLSTLDRRTRSGQIAALRDGRIVRYRRDALDAYLDQEVPNGDQ